MEELCRYDRVKGEESETNYSAEDLQNLVEQLGGYDWGHIAKAQAQLVRAGQAGIETVIQGLSHSSARVRRGCADFMDHNGTDACFVPLQQTALHDPVPSIRRAAVHSACCQRCKSSPLTGDLIGFLVQIVSSEPNKRVREEAIWGLSGQPQDARAIAVLKKVLEVETDPRVRKSAHHALKCQDPGYKAMVDARARERGIMEARARKQG